jgi:hypothetical protein
MSIIDSPLGRCEAIREMVLLDTTQQECACEHGCPPDRDCRLADCFAEVSGLSAEHAAELKQTCKCIREVEARAHELLAA